MGFEIRKFELGLLYLSLFLCLLMIVNYRKSFHYFIRWEKRMTL